MGATQVSIARWMDKENAVYVYNRILLSHKKNEIMPFAATWMDLEGIMLSEISQRKTNTVWYHLYMESKKCNRLVNITKRKKTHGYREQTSGYQWEEGRGRGIIGVEDWEVQTIRDKISYKDILDNTGIESMFYNNYKWSITSKNCDSLYCTLVTSIIFYSNYTSIKNKTNKKEKKTKKPEYI